MSVVSPHHLQLQESLNIVSPEPTPSTSPKSSPLPIMNPKKSRRTVIREKWVCDKCRVASFDDFDEACRHEENCTGFSQVSTSTSASASASATTSASISNANHNIQDLNNAYLARQVTTETTCNNPTVSEPTSENDSEIASEQELAQKQQREPIVDIGCQNPSSLVSEFTSEIFSETTLETTSETNNEPGQESIFEMKRQSQAPHDFLRRRSKRVASNNILKSLHTITPLPSSDEYGNDHVSTASPKKKKKLSTTSSSRKKQQTVVVGNKKKLAETTLIRKQKKTKPLASIFQPSSRRTKVNSVQPSPKRLKSVRTSGGSVCGSGGIDKDEKALLAEHRAAEFVMKRRADAELERQRGRKREEARKHRIEYQRKQQKTQQLDWNGEPSEVLEEETTASIFHKSVTKIDSVDNDSSYTPDKSVTIKQTSKDGKLTPKHSHILLSAPRFPNPSHIVVGQQHQLSGTTNCTESLRTGQHDSLLKATRPEFRNHPTSLMDRSKQRQEDELDTGMHGLVYQGLASAFRGDDRSVRNGGAIDVDASRGTQLWPDKHTIELVPDDVCGSQNRDTANDLVNFINDWRDNRHRIISTRAKRRCKQQKRPQLSRKNDDSDYEIWDDSEDDDGLCKVFLLTGPSGSGKTSLLYAAAKKCHCLVLEINTAAKRGGQDLKKAIEESTQSHSSFANLNGGNDVDYNGCSLGNQMQKESDSPSLVLVLIDEVDLLFESDGDIGFWQSLNSLTQNAKCPIILTSTNVPQPLLSAGSINYIHGTLTKPTPMECATKMMDIANIEGMVHSMEDRTSIRYELEAIAKLCHCDLRKIINHMELFSHGSANFNKKVHFSPVKSNNTRCCHTDVCANPEIFAISPREVSSSKHTLINIQGKNFMFGSEGGKDTSFNHTAKLEVMVGGKICSESQILNDETIIAVCPPCLLPPGVDKHGHLEDMFEDCLTCKYAPIVVKITLPNGMFIRSDAPKCRISDNVTWKNKLHNVEYIFPDEDANEEASFDCEDISITKLFEKQVATHNQTAQKMSEDHIQCKLSPQKLSSSVEEIQKEQSQMLRMMRNADLASDAALLEDVHLTMNVPELSGPVCGFGTETTGYKNLFGYDHTKHITQYEWDDSSFFFGTSDTYMTRPMRQRDRFLSAVSHNESQEVALSPPDLATSLTNDSSAVGNNCDTFVEASVFQGEEDSFYSSSKLLPIQSLPTMLRTATTDLSGSLFSLEHDVRSYLLEYEKGQRTADLLKLVQPIIGKTIHNASHDLALDYAPNLRNMAYLESIAESFFTDSIKNETGDNLLTTSSRIATRRQTRNGPKGREHYFDKLFKRNCSSSFSLATTDMGKVSGASLADMCLTNIKVA